MPAPVVQVGFTAMCPHGGQISVISSNTRVLVGGMPAATFADTYVVAACPFVVGNVPQPCLKVQWIVPAQRVLVGGQPVILQTSTGLCQSAVPQGPPTIVSTQLKVIGT